MTEPADPVTYATPTAVHAAMASRSKDSSYWLSRCEDNLVLWLFRDVKEENRE